MDYVLPKPRFMNENRVYKNYYSDDRQDQLFEMIFGGCENGVYIDIGAGNGCNGNNTLLYKDLYKWSGICIESDPKLFNELKMYRPSDINLNLNKININDIMIKYNKKRIGLLTLNVPNQLEILKTITNYDIDIIEFKNNNKLETETIVFLLNHNGYKLVAKTVKSLIMGHTNSFFVKNLDK